MSFLLIMLYLQVSKGQTGTNAFPSSSSSSSHNTTSEDVNNSTSFTRNDTYSRIVSILTPYFGTEYASMYWNESITTTIPTTSTSFNYDQAKAMALQWLSTTDKITMDIVEDKLIDSCSVTTTNQHRIILERYVMAVLYYATNGPNWYEQFGFLNPSAPICYWSEATNTATSSSLSISSSSLPSSSSLSMDTAVMYNATLLEYEERADYDDEMIEDSPTWYGQTITCIDSYITEVQIGDNNMHGQVPSELSKLLSLTVLAIYSNSELRGPIPSELGLLSTLEFLSLSDNELSGTIPEKILSLPSLEYLLLNNNGNLYGPIPNSLFQRTSLSSSLKVVDLSRNKLSGPFPSKGLSEPTRSTTLESLKYVDVSYNAIDGKLPTNISQLATLETFHVEHNKLTGSLNGLCAAASAAVDPDIDNTRDFQDVRIITADSCGWKSKINCTCCNCAEKMVYAI